MKSDSFMKTRLKQILVQQLALYKFCTIEFKFGLFRNFSSDSNRYHYCQNFIIQIGRIVIFFNFLFIKHIGKV